MMMNFFFFSFDCKIWNFIAWSIKVDKFYELNANCLSILLIVLYFFFFNDWIMLKQNCVSFRKLNKQEKDSIFSFQINFFLIFSLFQLAYLLHFLHAIKKISISRRVPPFSKNRGNDSFGRWKDFTPKFAARHFYRGFIHRRFHFLTPGKRNIFIRHEAQESTFPPRRFSACMDTRKEPPSFYRTWLASDRITKGERTG